MSSRGTAEGAMSVIKGLAVTRVRWRARIFERQNMGRLN
jgi:hypothetical protein